MIPSITAELLLPMAAYFIGLLIGRYIVPNPRRRLATIEAVYHFPRRPEHHQQVWHLNRAKLYTYDAHEKDWLECEL